jgi:hypothetical protein
VGIIWMNPHASPAPRRCHYVYTTVLSCSQSEHLDLDKYVGTSGNSNATPVTLIVVVVVTSFVIIILLVALIAALSIIVSKKKHTT